MPLHHEWSNLQFTISHLLNSVLGPVGAARVSLIASSAVEPEYILSLASLQYLHSPLSVGAPAEDRNFFYPLQGEVLPIVA